MNARGVRIVKLDVSEDDYRTLMDGVADACHAEISHLGVMWFVDRPPAVAMEQLLFMEESFLRRELYERMSLVMELKAACGPVDGPLLRP